jgi:hypothetical protein
VTAAVLDRLGPLFDAAPKPARDRFARPSGGGRGATLEERLDAALNATRMNGSTECPICDARMTSTRAGAECGGCGARLK